MVSYVTWLGQAMIDRKEYDFARLANEQMHRLDGIRTLLDGTENSVRTKSLRDFADRTESLLCMLLHQDVSG